VVEIDPSDSEALFNRGALYAEKGDRAKALADMKAAARLGHRGAREFLVAQGVVPPGGGLADNKKDAGERASPPSPK
jgi:hypothetical protein